MCRNKQLKIWSHLVDLLSALEEDETTDEIKQKLSFSSAFTGRTFERISVLITVILSTFRRSR